MNSKKNNSHGEKSTPINIDIHFVCNIPNVVFMFSSNLFSFSIYQWITDDAVAAINQQPWMEVKRWSTLTTSTFGFQLFWVRMLFLEYILSPCPTLTLFPIASSPTSPPPLSHPHVVVMFTSNLFLFSLYRWIFYVAHCSGHIICIWIRRDEFQEEQQPLMKVNANQHRQPQRLDSIFCQFFIVFIYPTIPPLWPISTLPLPLLRSPRGTLHAQFSPF